MFVGPADEAGTLKVAATPSADANEAAAIVIGGGTVLVPNLDVARGALAQVGSDSANTDHLIRMAGA